LANPLNSTNTPPVSNGNPTNMPAQGGIRSPLDGFRNPPRLQHPALRGGNAGGAIVTPVAVVPGSAPQTRDTGTNPRSR
jgi:hypothetical protein